jgi:tryptophan 7-halogenase
MNGMPVRPSAPARIRRIAIIGNDVAAWMTAAALARTFAGLGIALSVVGAKSVDSDAGAEGPPAALTARPTLRAFHHVLGLDEDDLIRATDATFSLGTRFIDWSGSGARFLHVHGDYGARLGGIEFHQHWVRLRRSGAAAELHEYSLAALAAIRGKFVRPTRDPRSPLSTFSYGLNLQAPRYREALRAQCRRLGVEERIAEPGEVRLRSEDGFIESVQLRGGGEVHADLFLDCTGQAGLLIERALRGDREDWSKLLPVDRVLCVNTSTTANLDSCRTIRAVNAGWRLTTPLRTTTDQRLYYRSDLTTDDDAIVNLLGNAADTAPYSTSTERIRTGRAKAPWLKNCVAIGASACRLDALAGAELHVVQSGVARLIAHFPDRPCDVEVAREYNRIMASELDGIRDFVTLHYAYAAGPDSPFWQQCRRIAVPEPLLRRIRLFAACGRVVSDDKDLFDAQTWAAAMLGLGMVPERTDIRLDSIDEATSRRSLERMAAVVAHEVVRMPDHAAVLRDIVASVTPTVI